MATIRENVVIVKGVQDVKYKSCMVTKNQPFNEPPKVQVKDGVATIVFSSGRKKSKPVAEEFARKSKSMYASQGGSGGAPKELNFLMEFEIDGKPVILAQGSNGPRNNWWVGHDGSLKVTGLSMRTVAGKAFDSVNLPSPFGDIRDFLGKLFSKDLFEAVNMFEIKK